MPATPFVKPNGLLVCHYVRIKCIEFCHQWTDIFRLRAGFDSHLDFVAIIVSNEIGHAFLP